MNIQNEDKPKGKLHYLKRIILEILAPHWLKIIILIALMIAIASTNAAMAYLIKPAVDQTLFNIGAENKKILLQIPIVIICVAIARGISTYYQIVLSNYITQRIVNGMRLRMYNVFINSDIKYFSDNSASKMVSNVYNDIGGMMVGVNLLISGVFKNFFSVVFLFAVMFTMNPKLTLVSLIGFPLAVLPVYWVYRRVDKYMHRNQAKLEQFTVQMDDSLRGIKVVKSYNAGEYETARMKKTLGDLFNISWRISRVSSIPGPMNEMLAGVGTAAVLFYGGSLVFGGDSTPGGFFAFFAAMLMAYKPLKSVGGLNVQLQMALVCAQRVFEALDIKPEIKDRPDAITLQNAKGNIEFKDVSFSYVEDKHALDGVSFNVEAGKTYAFVGHSGGGKSTIMSLLLRFYDTDKGSIKIEGHDIKDITIKSLRDNISYVGQDVQLFDDTVKENIKYSKRDATDEDVIAAAKLAEAHDFIMGTENQYETEMGSNGQKFSGGQRQRISIARAILRNTPILLLDEATSALDPVSEKQVQQALTHLMKGKTTLVIAHRLSTVMNADKIFVLNHGKIVEEGTHQELLAKNGEYALLYSKQFQD